MSDISTRNVKSAPDIVVDRRFFVPDGIIDVRYSEDQPSSAGLYDDTPLTDTTAGGTIIIADGKLQPPSEVSIVSQTVRVTADGSLAIDVVLEVTGNTITTTYETRLTKV
jgi:hypothetical protein